MRWALLLVLVGCGRIGFDLTGGDATGDARTGDGASTGSDGAIPGSSVTNVGGNFTDIAGAATVVMVTVGNVQPGDAILVSTGWHDITANVTAVTDSIGTPYVVTQAVSRANTISQALYSGFAPTTAASLTVTVAFGANAQSPSERVVVYRGVSSAAGIQGANGSGNGPTLAIAGFSAGANWVMVASNTANAAVTGVPAGWTKRLTTGAGDVIVDAAFPTLGIHTAMASLGGNVDWITQTFELPPP